MNKNNLLIFGIVAVVLFFVLFWGVSSGTTQSFDSYLFKLINIKLNVPQLDSFFALVSVYGREYFWIPVVALMWVLGKKNEKRAALILIIVFIIIIVVGTLLKDGYYRARPPLSISNAIVLIALDSDSSFPSGHAMIVMGGAVVALALLKKRYSLPLLAEALVVSYSRVFVGVHYPIDVLAGALLGAGIAALCIALVLNTRYFNYAFNAIDGVYNKLLTYLHLS